jgi:hypothetical protein
VTYKFFIYHSQETKVTYKIFIYILYNMSYLEIGFADSEEIDRENEKNENREDAPKGHLKKSEAIFQGEKRVPLTLSQQVGFGQVWLRQTKRIFIYRKKKRA